MPQGPDHRGVVLPLLDALVAMGRGDEADQLRRSFEARDWDLQQADVARVLGLLSAPRQQELPLGPSVEKSVAVAQEDHPDDPSFIQLYRPFLEAIRAWRDLLDATNQLLSARSWEALGAACEEVFCGALGFDDDRVPLTHRLRGKSAVKVFEQLGSFKGFRVCLVRLTRSLSDTRWSNMSEHYRPCFRLVPRALLISYEPGSGAIRLVFRQRHGRTDTRPRYRCIVGPWFLRDSQENLLTICRRLDLCRPQFDEDAERYGRRVQAALECDVGALAAAWASSPLPSSGELPGLAMHTATTALMHGLLQGGDWQWGLRAHLGNLFPAPLKYGDTWLDLAGVDLVDAPADPDVCWREARSREQRLRLRLLIRTWDTLEECESFEIMTRLFVPDDEGWFWLEGRPYRYLPQAGADGRLLRRNALPDWVNQVDAVDDGDDDDDDTNDEELEHHPLTVAEGAVVDSVIGRAVERRLWRLIRYLRRKTKESMGAGQVRAALLATVPPGESLPLITLTAARTLMTPVDLARPEREMTDVISTTEDFITDPPAWACVDVSADLAAHRWAVVAGARVHPTGGLAVPFSDEDGLRLRVCTSSAFDVNPRLGADVLQGDRAWWIHWRLASFASLSPGRLNSAARVASVGHTLRGEFLSSSATQRAHVAPWVRPRGPMLRASVDVPKVVTFDDGAPILLVSPGDTLPAGGPWLQIPGRHLAHGHDEAPSNLAALLGEQLGLAASSVLVERSPWDCETVVVRAGVAPVHRSGSLVGWRGWIQTLVHGGPVPSVVLASGDLSVIEPGWHPEDLPYSVDGEVADVVLPGPEGDDLCFSGADGQVLLANRIGSATMLPAVVPIRERAALGAVDRLPRPGVRSDGEPWSWTRLRWLADGVDSVWAPSTQGAALQHELLAWCAGIGPAPGELPPETVTEVPISSRPHRVHQRLSTIRCRASCGCGTLTGGELLGARCTSCGRPVEPHEVVEQLRQCTLPMVVVHPWAKEAVAAILGLVPGEMETLLVRHGPQPVLDACHAALELGPSDHAMSRLRLPATHVRALTGQTRRRLGQMAELLSIPDCARELADRVRLERVGLPSLDLVKIGNTLGELKPTGSRLMAAYARLYGACWAVQQAMRLDSAPLLATAQVQLQACVDAVFGDGAERRPETLAGLLRATSPWIRPAAPSIMVQRPARASFPDSSLWWQQRARRAQVIEHHAMELVAIVWTLPGMPASERWQGVRAVARDLLDDQHDLAGLLELLHEPRGRPLQLPTDWEKARAALDARLRPALGEQSLAVLVPALGGWWMGEISDEHPSGAVWLPSIERGPDGFRRRLPPLSHMAWRTWPGLRAARPELGLGCLLGFQALHLPFDVVSTPVLDPVDIVEEVRVEVSAEPADEAVMLPNREGAAVSAPAPPISEPTDPTESQSASEDIRVVRTTLREWLEQR